MKLIGHTLIITYIWRSRIIYANFIQGSQMNLISSIFRVCYLALCCWSRACVSWLLRALNVGRLFGRSLIWLNAIAPVQILSKPISALSQCPSPPARDFYFSLYRRSPFSLITTNYNYLRYELSPNPTIYSEIKWGIFEEICLFHHWHKGVSKIKMPRLRSSYIVVLERKKNKKRGARITIG